MQRIHRTTPKLGRNFQTPEKGRRNQHSFTRATAQLVLMARLLVRGAPAAGGEPVLATRVGFERVARQCSVGRAGRGQSPKHVERLPGCGIDRNGIPAAGREIRLRPEIQWRRKKRPPTRRKPSPPCGGLGLRPRWCARVRPHDIELSGPGAKRFTKTGLGQFGGHRAGTGKFVKLLSGGPQHAAEVPLPTPNGKFVIPKMKRFVQWTKTEQEGCTEGPETEVKRRRSEKREKGAPDKAAVPERLHSRDTSSSEFIKEHYGVEPKGMSTTRSLSARGIQTRHAQPEEKWT